MTSSPTPNPSIATTVCLLKHKYTVALPAALTGVHNNAELLKAVFHNVNDWSWHEPRKIQLSMELSICLQQSLCCSYSLTVTDMVCDKHYSAIENVSGKYPYRKDGVVSCTMYEMNI